MKINNNIIASCSIDALIKIWNWKKGNLIRTMEMHDCSIVALHLLNSNLLISAGLDMSIGINIWHLGKRQHLIPLAHEKSILCLALID